MHAVLEPDLLQQRRRSCLAVLAVLVVPQRQHHILDGVQAWQQVELLEDEPQFLAAKVGPGSNGELAAIYAVEDDLAAGGSEQQTKQIQRRRFAAARPSYDGDELQSFDSQMVPVDRLDC